jgi:hypothetical protein
MVNGGWWVVVGIPMNTSFCFTRHSPLATRHSGTSHQHQPPATNHQSAVGHPGGPKSERATICVEDRRLRDVHHREWPTAGSSDKRLM